MNQSVLQSNIKWHVQVLFFAEISFNFNEWSMFLFHSDTFTVLFVVSVEDMDKSVLYWEMSIHPTVFLQDVITCTLLSFDILLPFFFFFFFFF